MKNSKFDFQISLFIVVILFNYSLSVYAQQSRWKINDDGWVLRKKCKNAGYDKFFAVGLWNVPGYTFKAIEDDDPVNYRKNVKLYLENNILYNMAYMPAGNSNTRIKDKIELTGTIDIPQSLNQYLDKFPQFNRRKDKDYFRKQYLKKNINDKELDNVLDSVINRIIKANNGNDYIWAPIDEIVNGGAGGGWCWHPAVGIKINERIKLKQKHTLVYTDLLGVGRGNTYLFEYAYLHSHDSLPANPPYEVLSEEARAYSEKPLLGFNQAYNGLPVYEFNNGRYSYKNYDFETLKKLFYENIKICAGDYRESGDVFGINAFNDFYSYPILAGITVDAIKDGIGPEAAVWLFFDGNGYAKPTQVSVEEYLKNIKCQIYTSIIHGATGILFWNDRSKSPVVFNALPSILQELKKNLFIIKYDTVEKIVSNDLHIMIKKDKKGKKYIIASNTSKTDSQSLSIVGVKNTTLSPLEVYVGFF